MIKYKQELAELEDGWAFRCSSPCNFTSRGWATKAATVERLKQHAAEHESVELYKRGEMDAPRPMQELAEFIEERGEKIVMASVIRDAELKSKEG